MVQAPYPGDAARSAGISTVSVSDPSCSRMSDSHVRPARIPHKVANNMPVPSLATDLYQLTMMAGYLRTGRHRLRATFELFTRRLPPNRTCLVFAGLEQAIDYLEHLR